MLLYCKYSIVRPPICLWSSFRAILLKLGSHASYCCRLYISWNVPDRNNISIAVIQTIGRFLFVLKVVLPNLPHIFLSITKPAKFHPHRNLITYTCYRSNRAKGALREKTHIFIFILIYYWVVKRLRNTFLQSN